MIARVLRVYVNIGEMNGGGGDDDEEEFARYWKCTFEWHSNQLLMW